MRTRILSLALAFCMIFALVPIAVSAAGTQTITTESELLAMGKSGSYILGADITLSKDFEPIRDFGGTFDGNGHTITFDENESYSSDDNFGLFANTNGATIKNLNIAGTLNVTKASYVGSLVGHATSTAIINCASGASVEVGNADTVGGLVGSITGEVYVLNSCFYGYNVSATNCNKIGGFIGSAERSSYIGNCYTNATVAGSENSETSNFIADLSTENVKFCYVEGSPILSDGVISLPNSQMTAKAGEINGSEWVTIKFDDSTMKSMTVALVDALNLGVMKSDRSEFSEDILYWNIPEDGSYPLPFEKASTIKPSISLAEESETKSYNVTVKEGYESFTYKFDVVGKLCYDNNNYSILDNDSKTLTIKAGLTKGTYTFNVWAEIGEAKSDPITIRITVHGANEPECNHPSSTWKVVTEPTYTKTGLKQLICDDCGEVLEEEIIPKLEKTFQIDIAFLVFETNGGEEMKGLSTLFGTNVNLNAFTPVREGYEFTGWYADKELTEKIEKVRVIGVTTVYAGWEEDSLDFIDVDKDDKYYDDIKFVFDSGLMIGTSGITFSPDMNLSRAMVTTILWRMNESPVVNYLMLFKDVDEEAYYGEAVRWASAEKIVNGIGDDLFAPDENVTREQLATIIYRYVQRQGGGFKGAWYFPLDYNDASEISAYADEAMHWCVMNGIIEADEDNNLRPTEPATRAETAHAYHILSDILA